MDSRQPYNDEQPGKTHVWEYWFLVSKTKGKKKTDVETLKKDQEDEEKYILCGKCENKITLPSHKMEVQGSFNHTFLNPAGHVFHIGCFGKADGCIVLGIPTSEWTWFQNNEWRTAVCSQCFEHLGWFFSSPQGKDFFGLILDSLI